MKNCRIMILSRQESTCKEMTAYFRSNGFSAIWLTNYSDVIRQIEEGRHRPDVIIFDLKALLTAECDVIRQIKRYPDIKIILESEDGRLDSQLYAYSMKIDDYMVKPVALPLVEAHVEAVLRRTILPGDMKKNVGAVTIDYHSSRIYLNGNPMVLTAMEYELMAYFIEHQGVILSRNQILDSVWGYDYVGGYRSVDTLVKKLRSRLTPEYPYIHTVYGKGYCFDVEERRV